ncbi:MAG: glutamate synthase subunit alpha, partial [Candidatus Lambdaproteobacteria bacterium]|nr:glutamate synthase subunit alpha [Candidatus Lambdaproteobacteria bacterium]
MTLTYYPPRQGLYDPQFEKESCGVGFVVDIKGRKSHDIVSQGLEVLVNLEHRGATGSDPNVGDGAGILLQVPDAFLRQATAALGFQLPPAGGYGVGMVFLPQEQTQRSACESVINDRIQSAGLHLLGWRTVPVDGSTLGAASRETQPYVRQVFVGAAGDTPDRDAFDRRLYLVRRLIEKGVKRLGDFGFYVASMSCKTMVYKGMLTAPQLERFYPDLRDPAFSSAIALVHARYSTNTFPSWDRAQPCRVLAHNGEINTLRGNINWMTARETQLSTPLYG